jgi:hypothetical protein
MILRMPPRWVWVIGGGGMKKVVVRGGRRRFGKRIDKFVEENMSREKNFLRSEIVAFVATVVSRIAEKNTRRGPLLEFMNGRRW